MRYPDGFANLIVCITATKTIATLVLSRKKSTGLYVPNLPGRETDKRNPVL